MAYYISPIHIGLAFVGANGDGYSINLRWNRAYPTIKTNQIAYHIYYSQLADQLFAEGPKFISIDGSNNTPILDLTPGQLYHFAVRAVEYNPIIVDPLLLPDAYCGLKYYPESILVQDITAADTTIPLLSTELFPGYGIIKIGGELINYLANDTINNDLVAAGGSSPTAASLKKQADGYYYLDGPSNVGNGYPNNLTLQYLASNQNNWRIICIKASSTPGQSTFAAASDIFNATDGVIYNPDGSPIIWQSDGVIKSNGVLSFSIVEGLIDFKTGDYFIVNIIGPTPGLGPVGRGFYGTIAFPHDTNGFDGYNYWSPNVSFWAGLEEHNNIVKECQNRFDIFHDQFTLAGGYHQVTKDLLTTNLTASDEYNVGFAPYDYAGYHRTDPVALLSGSCQGSYFGGAQGCADGYSGVGMMLRGLSFQERNNQRQEYLLSMTGEPVCLFKREWTGITCNCYLPSSEYPDDRCPQCFPPGTLVRTETGYKAIESLKIGDSVLSSDGTYQKVVKIFENQYDGPLQKVVPSVSASPIFATPEHPFAALTGHHRGTTTIGCGPNSNCKSYIERGDGDAQPLDIRLTKSGRWQARVTVKNHPRKVVGTFDTWELAEKAIKQYKSEHLTPGHILGWEDAKNLKEGDWLIAKWPTMIRDVLDIKIPEKFTKRKDGTWGTKRLGPDHFTVDEEFLWIVGLYIAEGSSGNRSINFALHVKELEYQNRVITFFTKHGYNPKISYGSDNGVRIDVYSTTLAEWFPKWLGKKCYNKQIPEELMHLPSDKTRALIQGIYDGDGSKRENEIGQTSEILALQLAELLHRLGEQPLVRKMIPTILTPKGNKRKDVYYVNWAEDTLTNHNRKGRWDFNGEMLSQIRSTSVTKPYSGLVYNLEVEGDHTYVVQGVVVHNCFGTKIVLGYQQYFNPRRSDGRIMVRFSPTDDDLKSYEGGLESEFTSDVWTLTVPTVKDRDFIVRFDQDGNEEFRYEILSVNRNRTLTQLEGAQKFRAQRVRKFDPIYNVPVTYDTAYLPQTILTDPSSALGIPVHSHTLTINEAITDVSQINQVTQIAFGHQHTLYYGSNQTSIVLGHFHTVTIP